MGNTHVSSVELPQDARLREIILGDEGAFKAWERILGKVVKPAELERLLLEALRPSANTPNLHRISVRETEQAIARIQRVIQDVPRLNMEYSDMLPGPPPPLGSRLGRLLMHDNQAHLLLADFLAYYSNRVVRS